MKYAIVEWTEAYLPALVSVDLIEELMTLMKAMEGFKISFIRLSSKRQADVSPEKR